MLNNDNIFTRLWKTNINRHSNPLNVLPSLVKVIIHFHALLLSIVPLNRYKMFKLDIFLHRTMVDIEFSALL